MQIPETYKAPVLGVRLLPKHVARSAWVGEESGSLSTARAEAIWTAVRAFYATGLQPGVALVIRHRGEVVLDRALGFARLDTREPMTTHVPVCLYSCSKAISSLLLHRLVEEGRLGLDDNVAEHVPEFAQAGKEEVTLRALLSHRTGIAPLKVDPEKADQIFDYDAMVEIVCALEASSDAKQAYHAVGAGYVLGEVARRVSGEELPDLLRRVVTGPLGLDSMAYGVPSERRDGFAHSYSTGPAWLPPLTQILERLLGCPAHLIAPLTNEESALDSVVPAAGIWSSAHDVARLYDALRCGGELEGTRILEAETVANAVEPAGPLVIDGALPAPIRFSPGFMLGEPVASLFGAQTARAFGHLGFVNILTWADPARELSVAFVNTGKAASPEGIAAMLAVSTAISAAFPVR